MVKGVEMTITDVLIVLTLVAGGIFIAGTIIHLIAEEIEYRRWLMEVRDDTRTN